MADLEQNKRMSVISSAYDRQGKGYLDDVEREMRAMDTKNIGSLDADQVYAVLEQKGRLEKNNRDLKKILWALAGSVVFLGVANLGTAYMAVSFSKDTLVQGDGTLAASSNAAVIKTRGLGYKFELEEHHDDLTDKTYYCTTSSQLASLWSEIVDDASNVNFVSKSHKNVEGEDLDIVKSTRLGSDAYTNGGTVCFPTANDGRTLCADFYSEVNPCLKEEGQRRRMKEIATDNHATFRTLIGNRNLGKQKSDAGDYVPIIFT